MFHGNMSFVKSVVYPMRRSFSGRSVGGTMWWERCWEKISTLCARLFHLNSATKSLQNRIPVAAYESCMGGRDPLTRCVPSLVHRHPDRPNGRLDLPNRLCPISKKSFVYRNRHATLRGCQAHPQLRSIALWLAAAHPRGAFRRSSSPFLKLRPQASPPFSQHKQSG